MKRGPGTFRTNGPECLVQRGGIQINLTMDHMQWLDDENVGSHRLSHHEFRARTHVDQVVIELPRLLGGTTLLGVQVDFKR